MAEIRKLMRAMICVSTLGLVAAGNPAQAEDLTVAAAPSLKPALQKIVPMFEKEYGATVRLLYGASPTLRRQIERGAAIDVFLPASLEEFQKLHKKGLILDGGPRIYAGSSLVLVASASSTVTPISLYGPPRIRPMRIALRNPKTSALGELMLRALLKGDRPYKDRLQAVHGEDSDDILNLLLTDQADLGLIYRVDAINNGQVRIIDETPTGVDTTVPFGEAVVWTCREASVRIAKEFVDFMPSPRIQKLLLQYGFDAVPSN